MNEANQKLAITGAILTVAVAIGLAVWYTGSLEAEGADDMQNSKSASEHFQTLEEEQISNPNVDINEDELDQEDNINTPDIHPQPQVTQHRWW